jgi:hypothetical protein
MAAVLCSIALLVAGAAPTAETVARITAVVGGTNVGDAAADRSAALVENASIQTADDGNCSMLVDEDALVELCASTIMTLTRRSDTGQRVVKIDGGTARIVVEPRLADERIEIHTPAAIATIMGTTVIVEVDRVTGGTKITSDKPVKITSNDPSVTGSAVSSNMRQVTISRGKGPSQPNELDRPVLANLGGCLPDFHGMALFLDRTTASDRTRDRLADKDGQLIRLTVGSEGPARNVDEPGGDDGLLDPDLNPCETGTDCGSSSGDYEREWNGEY